MSQSKHFSLIEAVVSTIVGFLVAITSQILIYPWYGIHINFQTNLSLTLIFTAISIVRGYCVRRIFNTFKEV